MTIVQEARSALQSGASTVLSTVQRRRKPTRRLMSLTPKKLMKQVNRRFSTRRARRSLVVPIALAVGATVVSTASAILVSRYFATKRMTEETDKEEVVIFTTPEAALAD
jgi:ABC-type Fe3+ transport system permease subunit